MQITPEAGRDTAKRFGVKYDWDRMVSDPVYNTQMGAGELSALLSEYKGNHIMTFAGYNAGRGRVRDWIKAYGDPRDPKVDAVDWVERIPLSETRNYVQRVMENLRVYRVRFEDSGAVAAKSDQRVVTQETNAAPLAPEAAAAASETGAKFPVAIRLVEPLTSLARLTGVASARNFRGNGGGHVNYVRKCLRKPSRRCL